MESDSKLSNSRNSGNNNDVVLQYEQEKTTGNATKSAFLHPKSKFRIVNRSFFYSNDEEITYIKVLYNSKNMSP